MRDKIDKKRIDETANPDGFQGRPQSVAEGAKASTIWLQTNQQIAALDNFGVSCAPCRN